MTDSSRPNPYVVLVAEMQLPSTGQETLEPIAQTYDLDEAKAIVEETARTYRPRHPQHERSRRFYERLDGSWVVDVVGATMRVYFTVFVARWQGEREKH